MQWGYDNRYDVIRYNVIQYDVIRYDDDMHLFHHLGPTVVLSWHNHFVHIKQRNPVVPTYMRTLWVDEYAPKADSLIVSGQENKAKLQFYGIYAILKLNLYMFL